MNGITTPAGVDAAAALNAGLDSVLCTGLARIDASQLDGVQSLAATMAGTPLSAVADAAVAALRDGQVLLEHAIALAACRESIEGARGEALARAAASASGLEVQAPSEAGPARFSAAAQPLLPGVQQWLMELAMGGFEHMEVDALGSARSLLPGLQQQPELLRLSSLLTLWIDELVGWDRRRDLPSRRWADLWTRALLLTAAPPDRSSAQPVSGSLAVLGADLQHGPHVHRLVVHGILATAGARQLVHVPVVQWKVDAVGGAEVWRMLHDHAPELVDAIASPASLGVEGMLLHAGGCLRWSGEVAGSTPLSPSDLDLSGAVYELPPPRDRHALQLPVPVVIDGAIAQGRVGSLPCDGTRVSPWFGDLTEALTEADRVFGLLRHDGGCFRLQPLCGTKKKKWITPAKPIAEGKKLKASAVDVLRERAARLLRG